jgi:MYXO-CTERM domain-containing protein
VVAGSGGTPGGSGTGGAGETGGSPGATDSSSGCDCVVGPRSPRGGMFAFWLLGALALARRRRTRT